MTLEETDMTVEQVQSVRDRSLEEAYIPHDVGEAILKKRLDAHGFYYEDHGDDARHLDRIVMGDGPDIVVYRDYDEENDEPVGLLGYIEIKTKESQSWFGRCNRRHFDEYLNFSEEVTVPVYIWFALVDSDRNVSLRDGFIKVKSEDQVEDSIPEVHGNEVVCLNEDHLRSTDYILSQLS